MTNTQRRAYIVLCAALKRNYPTVPSYQELMIFMGYKTKSAVARFVHMFVSEGLIEKPYNGVRRMTMTDKGEVVYIAALRGEDNV